MTDKRACCGSQWFALFHPSSLFVPNARLARHSWGEVLEIDVMAGTVSRAFNPKSPSVLFDGFTTFTTDNSASLLAGLTPYVTQVRRRQRYLPLLQSLMMPLCYFCAGWVVLRRLLSVGHNAARYVVGSVAQAWAFVGILTQSGASVGVSCDLCPQ